MESCSNGTPAETSATTAAIARALHESFPYVRAFKSHLRHGAFITWPAASPSPIAPQRTWQNACLRARPLTWWNGDRIPTAEQQFAAVLQERSSDRTRLISADRNAPAMQDDRPVNEYYWIRATGARMRWKWLETAPENRHSLALADSRRAEPLLKEANPSPSQCRRARLSSRARGSQPRYRAQV